MKACAHCGVPVADDQRYCLECGGRQVHARSQFLDRFTPATLAASPTGVPGEQAARPAPSRSSNVTIVAGVGVLLLAMGVGVLIGRAGAAKTSAVPAQVISVSSPTATTPANGGGASSSRGGSGAGSSTGGGSGGGASKGTGSSTGGGKGGSSASPKSSSPNSGQSFEQKSRSLPNVVSTG